MLGSGVLLKGERRKGNQFWGGRGSLGVRFEDLVGGVTEGYGCWGDGVRAYSASNACLNADVLIPGVDSGNWSVCWGKESWRSHRVILGNLSVVNV